MFSKLEQLCRERGISLYRLGKEIGISTASLTQWKKGVSSPSIKSVKKIADYFGVSVDYFVAQPSGAPASSTNHTHWIPVLGRVAAGIPAEMVEDVLDYEEIDNSVGEAFALVINGDSMAPQLLKGDVVIVRRQEDVENGDVAIVAVDGHDATCKRVIKTEGGVILQPMNPEYAPVHYSDEEILSLPVTILGRVVEIRRKL